MNRFYKIVAASVLGLFLFSMSVNASEDDKKVDWKAYGSNIALALRSDNLGLQRSALQTIIHKGEKIELGDGIHDLMNVYLIHEDERFKQMALVALHKTRNDWAMHFLRDRYGTEKSQKLKKLMGLILTDYFG